MLATEPLSSMEFARCWSKSAHVRSSERTAEEQRELGNGCWVMDAAIAQSASIRAIAQFWVLADGRVIVNTRLALWEELSAGRCGLWWRPSSYDCGGVPFGFSGEMRTGDRLWCHNYPVPRNFAVSCPTLLSDTIEMIDGHPETQMQGATSSSTCEAIRFSSTARCSSVLPPALPAEHCLVQLHQPLAVQWHTLPPSPQVSAQPIGMPLQTISSPLLCPSAQAGPEIDPASQPLSNSSVTASRVDCSCRGLIQDAKQGLMGSPC